MIDTSLVQSIIDIALVFMVLLLMVATYRVVRGPHATDRAQAIDVITNLLIGIIVLLAAEQDSGFLVDVAIALAALSFIASLTIARYLSEGRLF
jgi:multicomponent Na+:H+ antiporter subunit F